jgi:hypothetical protein
LGFTLDRGFLVGFLFLNDLFFKGLETRLDFPLLIALLLEVGVV